VVFFGLLAASALAQSAGQRSYPRFNFNVGGGIGIGRGAVGSFVGNSYFGVAGAGMNLNRWFGFDGEYMYYDLGIRKSVSDTQGLGNTSGALHAASLNGIVRPPYHLGRMGFYGIGGVGFYDRRLSSSTGPIPAGSICQPTWTYWWDIYCPAGTATPGQSLSSFSKIAGGFNYGGGITYRLNHLNNAKLYFEWRYHKAEHSDVQTIIWPVTVGLRW
jgi:hypothetical protein